jgi:HIT zinc finger
MTQHFKEVPLQRILIKKTLIYLLHILFMRYCKNDIPTTSSIHQVHQGSVEELTWFLCSIVVMSNFNKNTEISKSLASDQLKQRETLPKCEICQASESQYTCPRCGLRTCSLACCREHKVATGCSGKRDVTAYMALSAMTDQTLLSDYHFLSGGTKQVDTIRRLGEAIADSTTEHGRAGNGNHFKRPRHSPQMDGSALHPILKAANALPSDVTSRFPIRSENAGSRESASKVKLSFTPYHVLRLAGVKLLDLPAMMERHRSNQSKIIATNPPVIHWTVEIKFICQHKPWNPEAQKKNCNLSEIRYAEHLSSSAPYHSSTFLLHSIPETMTLLELHIRAANKLQLYYDDRHKPNEANGVHDPVVWLIKQIPCPDNRPVFFEKGTGGDGITLSDVLKNTTLIEFPTLCMIAQRHYEAVQVHFPCPIREISMD